MNVSSYCMVSIFLYVVSASEYSSNTKRRVAPLETYRVSSNDYDDYIYSLINNRRISERKCRQYSVETIGISSTEILLLSVQSRAVLTKVHCQRSIVNPLLVGGKNAQSGEFPHVVALGRRKGSQKVDYFCSGTLISNRWILTSAHCCHGKSPELVLLGSLKLNAETGLTMNTGKIILHPNYKPPAMYNDIALIELETSVNFNFNIKPACLYTNYETFPKKFWATGWGFTSPTKNNSSKTLMKVELNAIGNIHCTRLRQNSLWTPKGISASMLCAESTRNLYTDTCLGDSGGPLQIMHPTNCLHQVVAITSFGEPCSVGLPGVYTKVSHFLNWIESVVWPSQ